MSHKYNIQMVSNSAQNKRNIIAVALLIKNRFYTFFFVCMHSDIVYSKVCSVHYTELTVFF